jgi:hypothetical protein
MSSLYFRIAVTSSKVGVKFSWASTGAGNDIMNRIVVSLSVSV